MFYNKCYDTLDVMLHEDADNQITKIYNDFHLITLKKPVK